MLARNGKTPTEIGKLLTDERTLVPSEIVGNGHTRKDGIKRGWNRNTVKRILQNVTYLGWVSNGNTKKVNYKSKKTMIMPIEDRIIKKGMHTPIIDRKNTNGRKNISAIRGCRKRTYKKRRNKKRLEQKYSKKNIAKCNLFRLGIKWKYKKDKL